MFSGKNILIGITGGIAAYKICELIRMFKKANANVQVICTQNALNFVTKLTLQNLSKNEVFVDQFDTESYNPEHISCADKADIMIIAPASANTISKIANGICDNLLTSVVCAFTKNIIIAPAMNCNMWGNKFIQENVQKLKNHDNFHILEPESGYLACGYEGKGRLCSLDSIFNEACKIINCNLKLNGKKIIITAGGTIEDIDPVRYISNYSSGKMGIALADVAISMGADVTLITTCDVTKNYKIIKVKSALDMKNAVLSNIEGTDCIIMAAAVADFRVKDIANQKIKKTTLNEMSITLVKNPDILKEISNHKKDSKQIIVGFCAESENLIQNAKEKIVKKGCDYLIANDISRKDIGFSSDYNEITILSKNGDLKKFPRANKYEIAKQIFEEIYG